MRAKIVGVALTRVDARAHVRSGFADAEVYPGLLERVVAALVSAIEMTGADHELVDAAYHGRSSSLET